MLDRHPDGAYRTIEFEMKGVPGVARLEAGRVVLSREHRFRFVLPREYPQEIALIIHAVTPLFHPRFSDSTGKACYLVHGELDRVLMDLLANVLLRPDVVRPPDRYRADWGLDRAKMEWYVETGPERVHEHLMQEWRGGSGALEGKRGAPRAGRVRFVP
ncbi:MAG: hypothetical protein HY720_09230 [Planctomycetes bacterium]|nr:hypothetical protein [Planctomycetota bacterium]